MYLELIGILLNIFYEDKLSVRKVDYKTISIQLSNMLKYLVLIDTSKKSEYIEVSLERPCVYEYIIIVTKLSETYTKLLLFTKAQFFSYINEYFYDSKRSSWFSNKYTYTYSKTFLMDRASWLS